MNRTERNFLIHPHYIMMYLMLAGITALFLGFSAAYLYNRVEQGIPPVRIPWLFYCNSLLLVGSSYFLHMAKKNYLDDDTEGYKRSIAGALSLTVIFLIAQLFAWNQLQQDNIALTHSTMASYLYLISILHFAHVIAGIPFLASFLYTAVKRMKTPVSVLIYFSDEDKKRKLHLLNMYWHFLDGLWIYLVVFFLVNYLI